MAKERTKNVAATAEALLRGKVESLGYILWDVEYKKEGSEYNLILTIDKEGEEVTLDDCVAVTEAVNPILDEADPIEDSYCLEVSSAGLERELRKSSHFDKYMNSEVEIRLFAKTETLPKAFTAILKGYTDNSLALEQNGEFELERSKIALIKNIVDYKEIFKNDNKDKK